MSVSKNSAEEPNPITLAAQVANTFAHSYGVAYAQIMPDLTIGYASKNFSEVINDPTMTIEGQNLTELLYEFVGTEEILQSILQGDRPSYLLEHVNRQNANQELKYFTFQVTGFESPNQGLLLIIADTTLNGHLEQRLRQERNELQLMQEKLAQTNQELAELNRFKSFVLSMVAHDMRTPLTAMQGYAEILSDDPILAERARQKKMVSVIYRQARRLGLLLKNVLDLDKIEQGRLNLSFVTCNLNDVVQDIVEEMNFTVTESNISLSLKLPSTPLYIQADKGCLQQILQNLISNAVKYTYAIKPDGGGEVAIHVDSIESNAFVQIKDNGQGMTHKQRANLFKLYYRTDEAQKSKAEGSGLGLYIVKTLIDAHRGNIEITSQHNEGTTVSVSFPLIPDQTLSQT